MTKSKSALTLSFYGHWSPQFFFFFFPFLHIFFLSFSTRRLRHSRFVCLSPCFRLHVCHWSSVLRAPLQTGLRLQVWADEPLPTPRFFLPFHSVVALCLAVRSPAWIFVVFVPSQEKMWHRFQLNCCRCCATLHLMRGFAKCVSILSFNRYEISTKVYLHFANSTLQKVRTQT